MCTSTLPEVRTFIGMKFYKKLKLKNCEDIKFHNKLKLIIHPYINDAIPKI
jgi:hypothetical protein